MSKLVESVALDKIYISNLCNGSIAVNANIEEVTESADNNDAKTSTISFAVTHTNPSIGPGETYEILVNTVLNLRYIPAFYTSGRITIDAIVHSTTEPLNKVDLTFDALMYIAPGDMPSWYPYSLDLVDEDGVEVMCDQLKDIIDSPRKEVHIEMFGANTNLGCYFNINAWKGMRPIVNRYPPHLTDEGINMGCLPPVSFKITCLNDTSGTTTLSAITVSFSLYYNTNGTLCNLVSDKAPDFCQLYPGPKGLTEPSYLWAIVDGYDGGTLVPNPEVVKVFGYYLKTSTDLAYESLNTIVLKPIMETGGTNYPPKVYRSESKILSIYDHDRMLTNGFKSGEVAWVVTPAVVCRELKFKDIDVKCTKHAVGEEGEGEGGEIAPGELCSPNNVDAEFTITIKLRDDVEEVTMAGGLTKVEFAKCIQTVKFFNISKTFESLDKEIKILRADIDRTFYDSIANTLEDAVVLESCRNDIDPFALIKINSWETWIPIYTGKPIQFNESLTQCTDGVRTRELWFFGEKDEEGAIANTISISPYSKKQYRVILDIMYGKYKNMYLHKEYKEGE